jgi:hypothetical protein
MIHCSLKESDAFMPPAHLGCGKHNVQNEEEELHAVSVNLSTKTCEITYESGLSQSAVWCRLQEEPHLFSVQLAQELQPGSNNLHHQFCNGFYSKLLIILTLCSVLWTDVATFTRTGVYNIYNPHALILENPLATQCSSFQQRC